MRTFCYPLVTTEHFAHACARLARSLRESPLPGRDADVGCEQQCLSQLPFHFVANGKPKPLQTVNQNRCKLAEYARCTSTMSSLNAIRGNIAKHGYEVSRPTADAYLAAMRRLYVIEDLRPWFPSLRARSRVASTPGRFLADPSIAAAALGADDGALLKDLSTLGTLFESLCIRDLRVYAESLGGELYRYHDNTGLEADAVMTLRGGRYALMEVKLGASEVDDGARSLLNLAHKIDQGAMGTPSFCAVITPGGYAYKRSDGVLVLPITCLMP